MKTYLTKRLHVSTLTDLTTEKHPDALPESESIRRVHAEEFRTKEYGEVRALLQPNLESFFERTVVLAR